VKEEKEDVMEEFLRQHRQRDHSGPPPSTIVGVGVSLRLRVVTGDDRTSFRVSTRRGYEVKRYLSVKIRFPKVP
jgi:hypothetical protein